MKNISKLYWASVNFRLTPEHANYKQVKKGFTHVFVPSATSKDARAKVAQALQEHKLALDKIDFIKRYNENVLKSELDKIHFGGLKEEAEKYNDVVLDELTALE